MRACPEPLEDIPEGVSEASSSARTSSDAAKLDARNGEVNEGFAKEESFGVGDDANPKIRISADNGNDLISSELKKQMLDVLEMRLGSTGEAEISPTNVKLNSKLDISESGGGSNSDFPPQPLRNVRLKPAASSSEVTSTLEVVRPIAVELNAEDTTGNKRSSFYTEIVAVEEEEENKNENDSVASEGEVVLII